MKSALSTLLAVVFVSSVLPAQIPPVLEDFETGVASTTAACSVLTFGTYPAGWTLDGASTNAWRVRTGTTPSSGTGPTGDHTSGTGNYVFLESSSCVGAVGIITSPIYDASGLSNPSVSFFHHMFGPTTGTLSVEAFDGTTWVQVWTLSGDQGNQWNFANAAIPTYNAGTEAQVRFVGIVGSSFTSDMALDDVLLEEEPSAAWQSNQDGASLDIDGVLTDGFFNAAIVNRQVFACLPTTGTLSFSTVNLGQSWNVAFNTAPLVPFPGGATLLPDGQVVNIDFSQGLSFFNPDPLGYIVPGGLPGQTSAGITMPFSLNSAVSYSMQAYCLNPAALLGVDISQATELNVVVGTSIAGPSGDDVNQVVSFAGAPGCFAGGFPFFGTVYNDMNVNTNGRVLFGGSDTDFTPTLAELLTDNGSVGYWTDLDTQSVSGAVTISDLGGGVLSVDYNGIFYRTEPQSISFSIEFDSNTGSITLNGLTGIAANPLTTASGTADVQILGLSGGVGIGATDPGLSTPFAAGMSGSPANSTDALYDFNNPVVSLTGIGAALGAGTLNSIMFMPSGTVGPNYDWIGLP